MKHVTKIAALATTIILSASMAAVAAPNIYGESGMIEVPDDATYAVGTVTPAYHGVYSVESNGVNSTHNFYTVGVGLLPNLSVSGGVISNGGTNALLNAKYRITPETANRPSFTIGVTDMLGEVGRSDSPGLYFMVGKNLTSAASEVVGGESKPLRGYLGIGTGVLEGVFVGLDWRLAPKVAGMVEYLSSDQGLTDESHFNAGLRFALTNEIRLDVGTYAFKGLTAGISYNALRF